jgi:hypothetical protein
MHLHSSSCLQPLINLKTYGTNLGDLTSARGVLLVRSAWVGASTSAKHCTSCQGTATPLDTVLLVLSYSNFGGDARRKVLLIARPRRRRTATMMEKLSPSPFSLSFGTSPAASMAFHMDELGGQCQAQFGGADKGVTIAPCLFAKQVERSSAHFVQPVGAPTNVRDFHSGSAVALVSVVLQHTPQFHPRHSLRVFPASREWFVELAQEGDFGVAVSAFGNVGPDLFQIDQEVKVIGVVTQLAPEFLHIFENDHFVVSLQGPSDVITVPAKSELVQAPITLENSDFLPKFFAGFGYRYLRHLQ